MFVLVVPKIEVGPEHRGRVVLGKTRRDSQEVAKTPFTTSYWSLVALVVLLHDEKTLYSRSTKLCIIRSKTGSNLSKSSLGAMKIM